MLRAIKALFILCLAFALLASGEALGYETRFGTLTIVRESDEKYSDYLLLLDGKEIEGIDSWSIIYTPRVINWGARGDVVFLSYFSGGANCCELYQFLRLSSDGVEATNVFNEYMFMRRNSLRVTPESIQLD